MCYLNRHGREILENVFTSAFKGLHIAEESTNSSGDRSELFSARESGNGGRMSEFASLGLRGKSV
jgi:hypothetical protein